MAEGKRGGMSKNSFGGRKRLDHLDLMKFRPANTSPEKMLFLATIQDALQNYLFYGLGRNGTSADEFLAAYNYFMVVRSTDPTSWPMSLVISEAESEESYTIDQIKAMCFDIHYDISGLADLMPIEDFVRNLSGTRKDIMDENWEQIKAYFNSMGGYPCLQSQLATTLISPSSITLSRLIFKQPQENNEPAKVSGP